MQLYLATPTQSFPAVEVQEVTLPTATGEIVILPGHAPLFAGLESGNLVYRSPSGTKTFAVGKGVVEVKQDQITVLADEVQSH